MTITEVMRESTADRAASDVRIALADFYLALQLARTNRDALLVYALVNECAVAIATLESAALDRADALCGMKASVS